MKIYALGTPIPDAEVPPFPGTPEQLGGRVLEGDVRVSMRVDFQQDGLTAGIFEVTRGKVEIVFPFTEHATVLEGQVTLTDASGQSHTYKPGDSYFIRQGERIVWDVPTPRLRKSFFNLTR
jgi:uncharacterized protein